MRTLSESIQHHREQYIIAANGGPFSALVLAPYHMFWLNHYISIRVSSNVW